ncbi:hypothetical protein V6N12_045913 [Hibiscus sabdariffa]|uniref:Uncharacterized protein n=1 Tax=Hibiscus sabdariffa TaxID=183260 RepID=A0ABR2G460_9ROSI
MRSTGMRFTIDVSQDISDEEHSDPTGTVQGDKASYASMVAKGSNDLGKSMAGEAPSRTVVNDAPQTRIEQSVVERVHGSELYGPWMVVDIRRKLRTITTRGVPRNNNVEVEVSGSKFSGLHNEVNFGGVTDELEVNVGSMDKVPIVGTGCCQNLPEGQVTAPSHKKEDVEVVVVEHGLGLHPERHKVVSIVEKHVGEKEASEGKVVKQHNYVGRSPKVGNMRDLQLRKPVEVRLAPCSTMFD